jgi:hypothetical protein
VPGILICDVADLLRAVEVSSMRFACPACAEVVTLPARAAGKTGPCPACRQRIRVPGPRRGRATLPQVLWALLAGSAVLVAAVWIVASPSLAATAQATLLLLCGWLFVGGVDRLQRP